MCVNIQSIFRDFAKLTGRDGSLWIFPEFGDAQKYMYVNFCVAVIMVTMKVKGRLNFLAIGLCSPALIA